MDLDEETGTPTATELLAEHHAWVRRMFWRAIIILLAIGFLLAFALGMDGIEMSRV